MVDQARGEKLGVAWLQRAAVFDATDTAFAATIVAADIAARAAVMSTAWQPALLRALRPTLLWHLSLTPM